MPITIVVGAIKYSDPEHQDGVDKGIESSKRYDVKSKSAKDFYDGVKRIYDACLERNHTAECCCIEHLIIDGHSTAGLGGREGLDKLSNAQISSLKAMLCTNATITVLGCFVFNLKLFKEYKLHLDLAMLLAERGGTYEGCPTSAPVRQI